MLLINRLQPIIHERLESYLERLRRANYYKELRWYTDLLAIPVPGRMDLLRLPQHYLALQACTGLSEDVLYDLTLHRFVISFLPIESM
jgi:hypothetical protein